MHVWYLLEIIINLAHNAALADNWNILQIFQIMLDVIGIRYFIEWNIKTGPRMWMYIHKRTFFELVIVKKRTPQRTFISIVLIEGIVEFCFKIANAFKVHGYCSYSYLWYIKCPFRTYNCYECNFRPQNVWNLTNTIILIELHFQKKYGER